MPESSSAESAFPRFLRFWRQVFDISQEELAHRLGISPRHVSRLENGASRPSQALVVDVATALEMGERDSNQLLVAAGYRAVDGNADFHAPELKWLRKALTLNLKALDPYPSAILDSASNILMVNRGWVAFYLQTVAAERLSEVRNQWEFLFSHRGAGNLVSNWGDTLSMIAMSLKQRALHSNNVSDLETIAKLEQHPSLPGDWQQRAARLEPMASFRVQVPIKGSLQRFFSVSTTVSPIGPATYIAEPAWTVNTLYPESDDFDFAELFDDSDTSGLSHPLLFY